MERKRETTETQERKRVDSNRVEVMVWVPCLIILSQVGLPDGSNNDLINHLGFARDPLLINITSSSPIVLFQKK
jgi:hypothetical protein